MFKIVHNGSDSVARYDSERSAWRAVHELVEEWFGLDGDPTPYIAAIDEFNVVPV